MSFEETARAYCKARVEWLAIKRAMAATPCEHERDPDCRLCWVEFEEGGIARHEMCAACFGNNHHRARRALIGKQLSNLMKRMLQAYREEGGADGTHAGE